MATKRQLSDRWKKTELGMDCAMRIAAALSLAKGIRRLSGLPVVVPNKQELTQITAPLPFSDEVAPELDLRGLELNEHSVTGLDIPGAHLEYAVIRSGLWECRMIKAHCDSAQFLSVLSGDFSYTSFVGSKLKRIDMYRSVWRGAIFDKADLSYSQLWESDFSGCSFRNAKVQLAHCIHADFCGADLRDADLSGANLAGIKFNTQTRVDGAIFDDATLSPDFKQYVQSAGAVASAEHKGIYELADYDSICAAVRYANTDGRFDHLLDQMAAVRKQVARDPAFDWGKELSDTMSPQQWEEFEAIAMKSHKFME